tara:strand:+ start:306 stop:521 length:216 start_codon:yes stop_codon:yes gene_type:complete
MKNYFTIIKSDLSQNEKKVAELLREVYSLQRGSSIKKAIKQFRIDAQEFKYSYTEKELVNACAFHNVLNQY